MEGSAEIAPGERVLVLMPSAKDAERTAALLAASGLLCVTCRDTAALCREIEVGAGAVLLTEEHIAKDKEGRLAYVIASQPPWSSVPLVVLSPEGVDRRGQELLSAVSANIMLVERPVKMRTLLSVLRSALRARRQQYQIRDALAERERQSEALRESEARARQLADNLPAGFIYQVLQEPDGRTRFSYVSGSVESLFGVSPAEVISDPITLYGRIEPEDLPRMRAEEEASLRERVPFESQFRLRDKAGKVRWLHCRSAPRALDTGGAIWDGVAVDITARMQAEEALRDADRRKDEFLATLAHELRNPLAPIRTGLQVLKVSPPGPSASRAREMMERQIAHMVRLIDDLLDVSRIARGKLELKTVRTDLRAVVESALEASRPLVEAGRHTLTESFGEDPLPVDADPTRLAQVISNLVNNAAKYTPEAGRIHLDVRRDGRGAVVRVTDTGVGIPRDMLPKVFEMFTQVGRSIDRAQGGLGIGLTLVRRLVELHGGTVDAESDGEGRGSTFTVRLPLAEDAAAGRPAEAGVHRNGFVSRAGRRILVVDDNVDGAESLSMLLSIAGHETRTAHSAMAAIEAAATFCPEVIFLDIGLPGMNGYEVARRLRADRPPVRPVIVALTGWGTESDKRKSKEAGFDHHLTKPVEVGEVEALLGAL